MPAVTSTRRSRRRTISEINMVPFIDVMLVLLIIFMVTAPLITPSTIQLPTVGKAAAQKSSPVQVLIAKDESVQITYKNTTQASSLASLAADVKKVEPATGALEQSVAVVVVADKSLRYETVMLAVDALRRGRITSVGLSVKTGA